MGIARHRKAGADRPLFEMLKTRLDFEARVELMRFFFLDCSITQFRCLVSTDRQ